LLVVNSDFHMPRTEAIFRWVFGAAPDRGYELTFERVGNEGLSEESLALRAERERGSLELVRDLASRILTFADLHEWICAYAWFLRDEAYVPAAGGWAESYGAER
jgi:hypothetical protein